MFTCRDSIELLLDFLDGKVPEEERKHLEEHLEGCPPCVDFLRTYQATPKLCRKAMASRMPRELADRLMAFLRHKCGR